MVELDWERIEYTGEWVSGECFRAKVLGGWLVRILLQASPMGGITFVPDPKHEWK